MSTMLPCKCDTIVSNFVCLRSWWSTAFMSHTRGKIYSMFYSVPETRQIPLVFFFSWNICEWSDDKHITTVVRGRF